MRKIDLLFNEYAESHQNRTNKLIHWICVPLIFWSILGFISLIPSPHFFLKFFGAISVVSLLALFLVSIFYFRLSWRSALIMVFVMLFFEHLVYFVNSKLEQKSWILFLTVFIISWIAQFLGHKIEGKKTKFFETILR